MKSTHTYVILPLSPAAFKEVETELRAAGYDHAFDKDDNGAVTIDLDGLAAQSTGDHGEDVPDETASLNAVTEWHLKRVLAANGGRRAKTAEVLGVDRRTIYRMIERSKLAVKETPDVSK